LTVSYTLALVADSTRSFVKWALFNTIGADTDATYVLESADAALPNSLVLTAGSGVTLTPGGGLLTVAASGGAPPNLFPYVDLIASIGGTCDGPAFSATTAGVSFSPNVVGTKILGVRFYWVAPSGGAIDVKCSLWQNAVSLGTGTAVAVPTGINTVTFTSPYTVQAGDLALPFVVSTFAPGGSGGYYCNVNAAFQTICNSQSNNTVPVAPVLASPYWRYQGGDNTPENVFGLSTTGAEAEPTTKYGQSTYFAMEPVFA
jgi:hypothetical protein